MSRLVWFALGAAAGMAYATRVIKTEHLDLAPGQVRVSKLEENQGDLRERLATIIDTQSRTLSEQLRTQGHALAVKIRGTETTPTPSTFGEPFQVAGATTTPADLGLETAR